MFKIFKNMIQYCEILFHFITKICMMLNHNHCYISNTYDANEFALKRFCFYDYTGVLCSIINK